MVREKQGQNLSPLPGLRWSHVLRDAQWWPGRYGEGLGRAEESNERIYEI